MSIYSVHIKYSQKSKSPILLFLLRFTRQHMKKHKFLHKVVLQEMKRRLYTPNVLPPLKTVEKGYEYYSTTSSYGMVYLRKKLGEGKDAPEVKRKENSLQPYAN